MLRRLGYVIFSIYFIVVTVTTFILFSIPIQLAYPFLGRRKHERYAFFGKLWANTILFLTGLLPKIHGRWPKGNRPLVYLFNHQSQLDILIALAVLPVGFKFVAKEELFKVPFLGDAMRKSGYISIKRQNAREASSTLEKVKLMIAQGMSILIFPEGTRTVTGDIGPIKRGSIMVAFETETPLLPVIINPAHLVMPKGSFLLRPRRIHLQIGDPIVLDWNNKTRDYTIESATMIESALKAHLQKIK